MLAADVAVKVRLLVAEHAGLELEAVQPAHSLQPVPHPEGLDLDSLDRVEIVMRAEDEFGLEITDEEVEAVTDVASLIKLVQDRLGSKVVWPVSADDTEGGATD